MWPFRKKALIGTQPVLDALSDRTFSPFPLLGGGSRQRIIDAFNTAQSANYAWIYTNSPAVRTVVDVLVRNIGQLDLRLYEEITEAERQPRPDHPAALSLRYPNPTVSSDQFVRSLVKDFLLFDNAYAFLTPAAGGQISLNRVPAHMVEIRGASLFEAEGYRIWRRDGTFQDLVPDQMLHWRGENPHDPRMGVSRLDTLRGVIAEDAALQQAIVELAQSGMQEPTWVYRPLEAPEWTNEDRQGFEEVMANNLRRRNRMPFALEEGMEMRGFGVSPKDAQMFEVRRWAIERVAGIYGVPLGMVGLADNVKDAQSQFYADTLPPYCEEFTKMLNLRILVRVYDWTAGCFEFNLDEKHMGDDRLRSLVSATGRAVMLTDEARAKLNLPPVEGGDELVTPLNVIVGQNPKPSVDLMPPQNPNGPLQDGSHRVQPPKALENGKASELVPQFSPRRKTDIARQHRYVDEAQALMECYYARQANALRKKDAKFDEARWNRELADDLHKLVASIVEREGGIYVARLAGADFDMRVVSNYLKAMSEGAAEAINQATQQDIERVGLDAALVRAAGERAPVAAASMGSRATIFARYEAAKQAPNPERRVKTWIADTRRHAEVDGQTVPLGDSFSIGFEPGSAPNCKCSLTID